MGTERDQSGLAKHHLPAGQDPLRAIDPVDLQVQDVINHIAGGTRKKSRSRRQRQCAPGQVRHRQIATQQDRPGGQQTVHDPDER